MPALKLYQLPLSPFSARVRIIAAEKNVPLVLSGPTAGAPRSPGLAAAHPLAQAPVLIDGSLALADTATITEYLDERYPEPPMMPTSPADRARSRGLTRFHDTALAPAVAEAYSTITAGRPPVAEAAQVHAQLASLERRITPSPWLFGDRFGVADAAFCLSVWYAVQITHAAAQPLDEAQLPRLLAWFDLAMARPSVALTVREAQSALDPQLVSRLCDPIWFGASTATAPSDGSWSETAA